MSIFRRKPEQVAVDPLTRLMSAVDEFNEALHNLPPGVRLSPWVLRRPGQRPLLILQEWNPTETRQVYPPC